MKLTTAEDRHRKRMRNRYSRPSLAESECGARELQAAADSSPKGTNVNSRGCQPTEQATQCRLTLKGSNKSVHKTVPFRDECREPLIKAGI